MTRSFWTRLAALLLICLGLWSNGAFAQLPVHQIDKQLESFLSQHQSLRGRQFSFSWLKDSSLPACIDTVEIRESPGKSLLWGIVSLSISCPGPNGWKKAVSIRVEVPGRYLVSRRSLAPGDRISSSDFEQVEGDLGLVGDRVLEDISAISDREIFRPITKGAPIRLNDTRLIAVIKRGETVNLTLVGQGFSIQTQGKAMEDAVVGAMLRIRTKEGKLVEATALGKGSAQAVIE